MHLPLITLLLQLKGGSTIDREAHSPNGIAVNALQKQLPTGIIARFGRSCQDQHRDVNRPMGLVWGGGGGDGGSGGSWVSQWENAFGLGARYQGGQGGHVQI